jgi:phosphomannomutase
MTIIGEVGPYRYETRKDPTNEIWNNILSPMNDLRVRAVDVTKKLFSRSEFSLIKQSINAEINPLLDRAIEVIDASHDRFMPFRIIQIGNIAERLLELSVWITEDSSIPHDKKQKVVDLLQGFYELKYPRFGTSGLRGRWNVDFTEIRASRTAQAICQYLADIDIPDYVIPKAQPLTGKWIVIGYDGRRNSPKVAEWLAEVAIANGFPVYLASRSTPTPSIAFFNTDHVRIENAAGILNCTASHNPSDWQGIKFNPREGYPAPTHLTDIIAARSNELQLMDVDTPSKNLDDAEMNGKLKRFDPISRYGKWIKNNGFDNARIPVNFDNIRNFFKDKLVIIDEMHGAGRGYLGNILGELGIPHILMHSEKDIDLGDLDYANPELPYIQPLMQMVEKEEAVLGLGLDTDADRFGVVGKGGEYFRPNQVLAMLTHYLGHEQKKEGRIVITQTGLPMINEIANDFPNIEKPQDNVIPAYVDHAFYKRRVGHSEDMAFKNVFVVPVGIKYIVEIPRMDKEYNLIEEDELGTSWMDNILLGGEESSGLTTRGHIPDKDGIWANLLIMDMVAYYQKPISEIWSDVTKVSGGWVSYGGRVDVDASDRAKERLISFYLDKYKGVNPGETKLDGYPILYVGGVRYDLVEIFLGDEANEKRNFLRIRASGTEPINRIYTETTTPELSDKLQNTVLSKLDDFTIEEIREAYRVERIADILAITGPGSWEKVWKATKKMLKENNWSMNDLTLALKIKLGHAENRNREIIEKWLDYCEGNKKAK